jgi:predicted TIM-barrel fold metal-dependent hydrolase
LISSSELTREFWEKGKSESCPVYDMHGHMGAFRGIYFPRADAARMIESMDGAGVRLLVFSHHQSLFAGPDGEHIHGLDAVEGYPDRLRLYLLVNPNYPRPHAELASTIEAHPETFLGFKFLSDYHRRPLSDDGYRAAWEYADACRLFVLAHTWGGSEFDGEEEVRRCAEKYPNVRFFLGHSLHGCWDRAVAVARDHPNVYLELTAVLDDRGVIERFVEGVGSNRLLFGTDLPWFDPHQGIGAVLSAHLGDDDVHNILHRNAEGLLAANPLYA